MIVGSMACPKKEQKKKGKKKKFNGEQGMQGHSEGDSIKIKLKDGMKIIIGLPLQSLEYMYK